MVDNCGQQRRIYLKNYVFRASKVAQQVRESTAKPNDQSSVPWTHNSEKKELTPKSFLLASIRVTTDTYSHM